MCDNETDDNSSDDVECPTCGRDDFANVNGMKTHHVQVHGESIAGELVECSWCGAEQRVPYHRAEQDHVFCGDECMGKWESEHESGENAGAYKGKVTVECIECGDTKKVYPSRAKRHDKHYCSGECQGKHLSENYSGEDSWHWKGGDIEVDCHWCGDPFSVGRGHYQAVDRHFCPDKDCESEWRSETFSGENGTNWKDARVEVNCAYCGDEKTVDSTAYRRHERHFCNMECLGKWRSENRRGESHPLYKGGSFDYGKGWNRRKKERVRERDNRVCQDCGMTTIQQMMKHGRKLNVHHIQKARSFDSDEERNAMGNLITLCQECHPRWERMSPLRPTE